MKITVVGWRKAIIEIVLCAVLLTILALLLHPLSSIDASVSASINQLPQSLMPYMQTVAWFGNEATLMGVAIVWSIFELIKHRRDRAITMLASLVSLPLFYVIKEIVRRNRPVLKLVTQVGFKGYSFPSGHATGSSAVYGVLTFLVARELPGPWNRIVSGLAVVLVILIGISRVYLGAHFPTDVLAGWLLGLTCYSVIVALQRRSPKEVEVASEKVE